MKKLLLILALLLGVAGEARAQTAGGLFNGNTTNSRGIPAGGVYVAICTPTATIGTSSTPCSPTVTIYSDVGLTQPISTNGSLTTPFASDGLGSFQFYVAPGLYTAQYYGPLVNLALKTIQVSSTGGGTGGGSSNCPGGSISANLFLLATGTAGTCNSGSLSDNGSLVQTTEPFQAVSVASSTDGTHTSESSWVGNTVLPLNVTNLTANLFGILGPPTGLFTSWWFQAPSTGPTQAGLLQVGAPNAYNVSQWVFSDVLPSDATATTPPPGDSSTKVATTAFVNAALSGTGVSTQYDTPTATLSLTSANNLTNVNMVASVSNNSLWRLSWYWWQVAAGSGCTGSGSIAPKILWTDPNGIAQSSVTYASWAISANGNASNFIAEPNSGIKAPVIQAKAGTAILYSVTFSAPGTCTGASLPTVLGVPVLEQLKNPE